MSQTQNNQDDQKEQKCTMWRATLRVLKSNHAAYLRASTDCESNKDFSSLKLKKDELKAGIIALKKAVDRSRQLNMLEERFKNKDNEKRHATIMKDLHQHGKVDTVGESQEIIWEEISARLRQNPQLIDTLIKMEETGGEPDAVWYDKADDQYIFVDCSQAIPAGRRNCCYDAAGQQEAEKQGKRRNGNAVDMAADMGIELLSEEQYLEFQKLDNFDKYTWTWLKTDSDIIQTGSALVGFRSFSELRLSQQETWITGREGGFRGLIRV